MTSSNIDPGTGRAVGDDDRDSLGLDTPDYTGAAGTGYAADTDTDAVAPEFGERDHTMGGTGYDQAADQGSGGYLPREGFDPGAGAPGAVEDAEGTGGVKEKAEQVAGAVGDQAAAVKDTVTERTTAVKDSVTDKAGQVADVAVQRAGDVAGVTKDELARLASDARGQFQTLWDQAAGQLREQAGSGQRQLAELVHGLAGELGELASKADSDGPVTSLLKQAAYRGGQFSHWLSDAETADVLTELRRFARRRPVVFLASATLAGILVGRLSRGLMAASETGQQTAPGPEPSAYEVSDATAATTAVVTEPPVSYAEVPDFSTEPPSAVDTGYPGRLGDDAHIPPGTIGGDRR